MPSQLFSVSYDLREPGTDYPSLTEALESRGAIRILQSHWVLEYSGSPAQLREELKAYIDSGDGLFVIRISAWASSGTIATPKDL